MILMIYMKQSENTRFERAYAALYELYARHAEEHRHLVDHQWFLILLGMTNNHYFAPIE
jgi:hypothetical protein